MSEGLNDTIKISLYNNTPTVLNTVLLTYFARPILFFVQLDLQLVD